MKICYIDIPKMCCNYNSEFINNLQRITEMCKIIRLTGTSIKKMIDNQNYDCVVIGFGVTDCGDKNPVKLENDINIPLFIILNKEYSALTKKLEWCKELKPRKIFTVCHDYENYSKHTGIPCERIMWSSNEKLFRKYDEEYKYDICFSGVIRPEQTENWRTKIAKNFFTLENKEKYKIYFQGKVIKNNKIVKNGKFLKNVDYAKLINWSKIVLTTTGPADLVGTRYFEISASQKALILCNKMNEEVYSDMFIDGFNCIMFDSIEEFQKKFEYYIKNDEERMKIVNNAYTYFMQKMSWDKSIINFVEKLIK